MMLRSLTLLLLVAGLAACQTPQDAPVDPNEGYESFGEVIDAMEAIPVQTVAAEGEALLGKQVKLEGVVSEVCAMAGCWMTLQVVDGPTIRIDVPRDDAGSYVYTFPKDASGRRAIVAGVLTKGAAHHPEGDDAGHDAHDMHAEMDHADGAMEGHDERETEILNASVYTLTATGALFERVRA